MNFEQFSKDNPAVLLITEGNLDAENFIENLHAFLKTIDAAVKANINLIQIREKKLPAKLLYELAVKSVAITSPSQTGLLINDRADIAFAAGADGVHLTSSSMQANIIRQKFPPDFIIGVSTHSLEEAEIAKTQKANFIIYSPIFDVPSKALYGNPQGLTKLRDVCEKLKPFPVIALGGINETNFQKVLENGAKGFAAIRFLNKKLQPAEV